MSWLKVPEVNFSFSSANMARDGGFGWPTLDAFVRLAIMVHGKVKFWLAVIHIHFRSGMDGEQAIPIACHRGSGIVIGHQSAEQNRP